MDYADRAFVEIMQTKERQSASLVKKFSSFTRAASAGVPEAELVGAYHEVMADCDELILLANRIPFIVKALSSDVNETIECIQEMKAQAAMLHEELNQLLLENEIRVQVAALNALPTRKALDDAYNNETERFLKPIVEKQAQVAEKVQLHRKHLTVLLAAIQQMEAELDVDHQFKTIPSDE
jgi:regulator of replication initiation timing